MPWGPEDFARYHFSPKATRKVLVYSTLMKHPNRGVTAEEINKENKLETDDATIEETRRVLREVDDLIETDNRKNLLGHPTIVYKPGKLLDSYHDPILQYSLGKTLGKGREEFLDTCIIAAIRCNNPPAQCPDPNCKICRASGIRTCWDQGTN